MTDAINDPDVPTFASWSDEHDHPIDQSCTAGCVRHVEHEQRFGFIPARDTRHEFLPDVQWQRPSEPLRDPERPHGDPTFPGIAPGLAFPRTSEEYLAMSPEKRARVDAAAARLTEAVNARQVHVRAQPDVVFTEGAGHSWSPEKGLTYHGDHPRTVGLARAMHDQAERGPKVVWREEDAFQERARSHWWKRLVFALGLR